MEITFDTNARDMVHVITLRIYESELIRANLDRLDRLLIADVANSNSIADKLLTLETIARRIEASQQD